MGTNRSQNKVILSILKGGDNADSISSKPRGDSKWCLPSRVYEPYSKSLGSVKSQPVDITEWRDDSCKGGVL